MGVSKLTNHHILFCLFFFLVFVTEQLVPRAVTPQWVEM